MGEDRIITPVCDLRTTLEYDQILKIIICKVTHPDTHLIIQFILYGIQGITNKDTYRTIIKQNKENLSITTSLYLSMMSKIEM